MGTTITETITKGIDAIEKGCSTGGSIRQGNSLWYFMPDQEATAVRISVNFSWNAGTPTRFTKAWNDSPA